MNRARSSSLKLLLTYTSFLASEDYEAITRSLAFSQSNRVELVTIQIFRDTIDEEDEEFQAVISLDSDDDSILLKPAETTIVITTGMFLFQVAA